jgi:thiosulfate sulfurtransferase
MSDTFKRIGAAQAQQLRQQGAVVVDIRDPQSYAQRHIAGAHHLDNYSLADFIAAADLDQPLIVTCYHGNSSQSAAAYLVGQGFGEVYSLDGGFEGWFKAYPEDTEQTNGE